MINEEVLKGIVINDKKAITLKNHIDLKKFGLKDFNKTNDKYKDYKVLFVTDFFNKFDIDIKEFLEDYLYNYIENEVDKKLSYGFLDLNKDSLTKSKINYFKTLINSITYNINTNFIKELQEDLNKNQIRSLTIIFYLRFYDRINNIMKEFLEDYLNNILED